MSTVSASANFKSSQCAPCATAVTTADAKTATNVNKYGANDVAKRALPEPQACLDLQSSCNAKPLFYHRGRLGDDRCHVSSDTQQSERSGQYMLDNHYACECGIPRSQDMALSYPQMQFRDGYGSVGQHGCMVGSDSRLRNGVEMTHDKAPQQLFQRPYLTVPYMGRGVGDACTENSLQEGEDTSQKRQCNTLAGISIDHTFTPLVPCLAKTIQDPVHIVPEANREDWIRGGYPSRQWVKNTSYCNRCQDSQFCRSYQKMIACPGAKKMN